MSKGPGAGVGAGSVPDGAVCAAGRPPRGVGAGSVPGDGVCAAGRPPRGVGAGSVPGDGVCAAGCPPIMVRSTASEVRAVYSALCGLLPVPARFFRALGARGGSCAGQLRASKSCSSALWDLPGAWSSLADVACRSHSLTGIAALSLPDQVVPKFSCEQKLPDSYYLALFLMESKISDNISEGV